MKLLLQFASIALLTGAVAPLALADDAALRQELRDYPADRGTCQDTAALVAQEAAAASGMTVLRSACAADNHDTYDLVIYYRVDGMKEVVTTDHDADPEYVAGNYATQAACNTGLAQEKVIFSHATGLAAAVAYCYVTDETSDHPWEARVDGLGVPTMRPYATGALFFSAPFETSAEDMEATLKERLGQRGVVPRSIHIRFVSGYYLATVSAYAAERFRLRSDEIAYSATQEQCAAQAVQFTDILSTSRSADVPLVAYCGRRFSLDGAQLTAFYFNDPTFKLKYADGIFVDLPACEAAKAGAIQFHRGTLGETVYGGYCTLGDGDPLDTSDSARSWHVALIEPEPVAPPVALPILR